MDWEIKGHIRKMPDGSKIEVPAYTKRIKGKVGDMIDNIFLAEEAMGFPADTRVRLLNEPMTEPHKEGDRSYQRHVAIEWEGGVLWLNFFDFADKPASEGGHYCIDVRQFNRDAKLKGEGVFTMDRSNGQGTIPDAPNGNTKGHGWNGGFVVSILTDPDGEETDISPEREER